MGLVAEFWPASASITGETRLALPSPVVLHCNLILWLVRHQRTTLTVNFLTLPRGFPFLEPVLAF